VVVAAGNDGLFLALATALGAPSLAGDPRFATAAARLAHVDALREALAERFATRATSAWLAALEGAGIPCAPIRNVAEVAACPQVRARNMVVSVEDPALGCLPVPGNPVKIEGAPDPPTRAPAPELDGDRARVLAWLDGAE
jgi:CoA:oxalate CoA-transferase